MSTEVTMDNTEICKALFEAFETGDEERARSLCSPQIQAWQNNNPPMGLDSLLGLSKTILGVVKNFRYEEAKRSATATGFVEEHRVRGTLPDGSQLDLAVCVVADVEDGQVVDLREYLDTAAVSGLIAALS